MIVHGRAMRVPVYSHEQLMEKTMLRRSIKDGSTIVDNVSDKLGYEYTRYESSHKTRVAESTDKC
jgi:hypothetical protein